VIAIVALAVMTTDRGPAALALICAHVAAGLAGIPRPPSRSPV
jgi:hypothetical protein